MTKLNNTRIITREGYITIHADYVCGMEYRKHEGMMYITYKQGGFAKIHCNKEFFIDIQREFNEIGKTNEN